MNHRQSILARGATLVVSLFCLLSLSGCFGVDSQFVKLRSTVLDGTGASFEVEEEFGVGSFVLGIAKGILGFIEDKEEDPELAIAISLLDQIKGVQIGTYRLRDFDFDSDNMRGNAMEVVHYMNDRGYDSIVRSFEDDSVSLIMVRSNPKKPNKINELLVVDFSERELALVQLRGDVSEIVDIATREKEIPGMDEAIEDTIE